MPRVETAVLIALIALVLPASAAERRAPPACSAIAFRPIPSGATDGVENAGLYRSRFGQMEVKADVQNGVAKNYFVEIDGKRPTPVAPQDLPKEVAACAKLKRLSAPVKTETPCLGDRLTVLTSHIGDKRYYLLYGHQGRGAGGWHFCAAGAA
ncbi:MAG: hypothetical protein ACREFQ_06780 [Stellaceae bacterium]